MNKKEEQNKRKGMISSVLIHTLLLAILILPLLTYPDPPPGQEGILVNLGGDFGQGDENAPEGEPEAAVEEVTPPTPEPQPAPEPVKQPEKEVVKEKPVTKPTPTKEVVTTEDPNAVALRKQKEEAQKKAKADADAKAKADADAKAKADADAKAKADADAKAKADAQALKDKLGGAFGGGEGSGKGNTGQTGNQGDKNGDPNAKNLEGISTGAGQVGGGLGSRGVVSSPRIQDSSQKTGVVVLKVCVDADGNVTTADYTLTGSTTQDSQLKDLAIRNARSWKFAKGADGQCGTIRYEFKVQ